MAETIESIEAEIASLVSQHQELISALGRVTDDIARLRLRMIELRYGIKVGDIVKAGGKLYRVAELTGSYGRPWVVGTPERKDGTFGTARRNLYGNWKVVDEERARA